MRYIKGNWTEWLAIVTVSSIIIFPRSFVFFKLGLLITLAAFIFSKHSRRMVVDIPSPFFILGMVISCIGVFWSLVGLINGADLVGVSDSLRLYVFWSIAWVMLAYFILLSGAEKLLHKSFMLSSICIVLINAIGVADIILSIEIIPMTLRKELDLFIGIHDGYIQITSHNIGSLFFLINYFLVILVSRVRPSNLNMTVFIYALLAIMVIISGRRALWLSVAVCHFFVIIHSVISPRYFNRRAISSYLVLSGFLATIGFSLLVEYTEFSFSATLEHLFNAVSADDERSLQAPFLIDGFIENFLIGNGFGVNAGYTRNYDRPWIYELVYHQLAFNLGIIGLIIVILIAGFIISRSLWQLRKCNDPSYILASLYGCLAFAIGCYSNPYIGSFDFLIYIWILPLLYESFHRSVLRQGRY
ncbi:hypothetical protein N9L51_01420 [Gammaproteobacteria bacterium]|nr:hypothetical protein [Gammaproteobacteria bacterium]